MIVRPESSFDLVDRVGRRCLLAHGMALLRRRGAGDSRMMRWDESAFFSPGAAYPCPVDASEGDGIMTIEPPTSKDPNMASHSRRQFLKRSVGAVAATAFPTAAKADDDD